MASFYNDAIFLYLQKTLMKETKFPFYAKYTFIVLAITFTVSGMIMAKAILVPLLVAMLLSLLLAPLTDIFENWKIPSTLATLLSILSISVVILGIGYFFYSQLENLLKDLPELEAQTRTKINDFKELLPDNINAEDLGITQENAISLLRKNSSLISQNAMALLENISLLILIPIYIFFMIQYRFHLGTFVKKLFNKTKTNDEIETILGDTRTVVRNYMVGMFLVILILIGLYGILFFSLGIKHAFLFAVFAGSLNIIPYVGPLLGSLVPMVFAFITKDSLWIPFGVVLGSYVIQLVESNFLTPKIVGGKVSMNPLITLITLLIGLYIWGIVGMILFIPLTAILKVIFDHVDDLKAFGFLLGDVEKQEKTVFSRLRKKVLKKQQKENRKKTS